MFGFVFGREPPKIDRTSLKLVLHTQTHKQLALSITLFLSQAHTHTQAAAAVLSRKVCYTLLRRFENSASAGIKVWKFFNAVYIMGNALFIFVYNNFVPYRTQVQIANKSEPACPTTRSRMRRIKCRAAANQPANHNNSCKAASASGMKNFSTHTHSLRPTYYRKFDMKTLTSSHRKLLAFSCVCTRAVGCC